MARNRPGRLDQRIELYRQVSTDDGHGGQTVTPELITPLWAQVVPTGGREESLADRLNGQATYLFTIRNRADLSPDETMLIKWDGVFYNIRFDGDEGGRTQYIELLGERGVAM